MSNHPWAGRLGRLALPDALVLAAMALALSRGYPMGWPREIVLGWLAFGVLSLWRPPLALAFAALTLPMYLLPLRTGISAERLTWFPLHELILVVALGAALWQVGWRWLGGARPRLPGWAVLRGYLPHGLFLLAGLVGLALTLPGDPRRAALREFRWTVLEPLLLYGLTHVLVISPWRRSAAALRPWASSLIAALVLGGTLAGLIGLLQFVGIDLIEALKEFGFYKTTVAYTGNAVESGGLRRVSSVFGHPNNLGLYLERIWPLAAALGLAAWQARRVEPAGRVAALGYALAALLCLGGVAVSFSRGAWFGTLVGLLALGLPLVRGRLRGRMLAALLAGLALIGLAGGLTLALRGSLTGGSTGARLLIWREALTLIVQHPLGLGLDQFYYYHNPEFGRSQIDPALIGTSEEFASHPHNMVLDLWLRMGPLGLLAFGWLLLRAFRQSRVALAGPHPAAGLLALGVLAALAAGLAHGLVDSFYFWPDLACLFWLLLALADWAAAGSRTPAD